MSRLGRSRTCLGLRLGLGPGLGRGFCLSHPGLEFRGCGLLPTLRRRLHLSGGLSWRLRRALLVGLAVLQRSAGLGGMCAGAVCSRAF